MRLFGACVCLRSHYWEQVLLSVKYAELSIYKSVCQMDDRIVHLDPFSYAEGNSLTNDRTAALLLSLSKLRLDVDSMVI